MDVCPTQEFRLARKTTATVWYSPSIVSRERYHPQAPTLVACTRTIRSQCALESTNGVRFSYLSAVLVLYCFIAAPLHCFLKGMKRSLELKWIRFSSELRKLSGS